MRRHVVSAALVLAVAALSGCALTTGPFEQRQPTTGQTGPRYASADGGAGACTLEDPCSLDDAIGGASPGSEVVLLDGDYSDRQVKGRASADFTENVVVRPQDPQKVAFGKLETFVPHLTWRDFSFSNVFYVKPDAEGTRIENVHMDGSGMFLKSKDIVLTGSVLENGASLDGVQIGGAENVLIENSVVRNYNQSGTTDYHADCVQIFDSTGVVLRNNYLGNCYNASIIFSGGAQKGLSDVLIEGNFVQGCLVKDESCAYGTLIDLREPSATNVVVRNNTMLDGSVRIAESLPGLVVDRNIFDYLSDCSTSMTNSIVQRWNEGLCSQPAALGRDGNRQGSVEVRDRAAGDFRLLDPESARIQPFGDLQPAPMSHDGVPLDPTLAGASN